MGTKYLLAASRSVGRVDLTHLFACLGPGSRLDPHLVVPSHCYFPLDSKLGRRNRFRNILGSGRRPRSSLKMPTYTRRQHAIRCWSPRLSSVCMTEMGKVCFIPLIPGLDRGNLSCLTEADSSWPFSGPPPRTGYIEVRQPVGQPSLRPSSALPSHPEEASPERAPGHGYP